MDFSELMGQLMSNKAKYAGEEGDSSFTCEQNMLTSLGYVFSSYGKAVQQQKEAMDRSFYLQHHHQPSAARLHSRGSAEGAPSSNGV